MTKICKKKYIEALLITSCSVRNSKYAYTYFPVFIKYLHELHELGFQREDLLSLMHNLYGQSLFRCRYKKRTCKPLNNTNVFEYRILTKHMPVKCTVFRFLVYFVVLSSEVTNTTGYYNFSNATIIIIHTQLLCS
jgi:hypothetical protein